MKVEAATFSEALVRFNSEGGHSKTLSLLALNLNVNFSWSKRLCRQDSSWIAWLLAGVWKLSGIGKWVKKGGHYV